MGQLGVHNKDEDSEVKQVVAVKVDDDDDADKDKGNRSEVVAWDKFSPRRMLRVLLVEADDSTRKIIAALLRKCNYKVAAISDGLEAWEILKRRHSDIDLILAELDLPSISGYALLTLIMEHDGYKNIPVVIMSSQDSISMVLKCMLKGAADFLIKPVRRNELKNLWRHVWRRLAVDVRHRKPRNPATGQHKAETTFEKDPPSNVSNDNVSSSQKNNKSSQKESNALSSCTTHYLEAEHTCMHNMKDALQKRHREGTGLSRKETAHHVDDAPLVQAFALGSCDSGQREAKFTSGGGQPSEEAKVSAAFKAKIGTEDGNASFESHRRTTYVVHLEASALSKQDVDMIGRVPKHKRITGQPSSSEELNRHNPIPELELTLKSSDDAETEEVDGMHMLNHLKASAFSRYNSNKKFRTIFPSTAGDPKQMEGVTQRSPCLRGFTGNREIKHKDFAAQFVHSEPSSLIPQVGLFPIPGVIFDGGGMCCAPMFQPVYNPPMDPKASSPKSAFQREESPFLTSPSLHSDMGTHSSTRGCSGLDEATKPSSSQVSQAGREVKVMHSVDPGGCSSTPCNNDYTTPSMVATSAMEESVRDDDGSHTFDLDKFQSRMGHHHSAEREAALAKFRLKRKGQCFEEKVTNQSRKRLAEQQPRVKGQFFHQAPSDPVIAGVDKP